LFERLKKLFFDAQDNSGRNTFASDGLQVAEAALMFHVIAADGIITDEEKATLASRVSKHFGLTKNETNELVDAARQADNEAVDLYRFTSTLNRELDYDARVELIANLWEMVYADGIVHELEDNIVWRVAELLDVSSRDRMEMKQRMRKDGPE
jgi:uncharacterized tellurite resistance protein B-like protein